MRKKPVGEDALIDLAHLPRSGDDTAAVDRRLNPAVTATFFDQQLGRELAGSVHRARTRQGKVFANSFRRSSNNLLRICEFEPGFTFAQLESCQASDRVDAAR